MTSFYRHALRGLCVVGLSGLLVGCAVRRPEPRWQPEDVAVTPSEAAQIRELLATAGNAITAFRGLFQVHVHRGNDRATLRQAIVFVRPDRLRVEALPTQGVLTLHLLVANRGSLLSLEPGEKKAFVGPASTALFRRFLNLPFRETEIMALVTGRAESGRLESTAEVRCGVAECTLVSADERYRWRVDRISGELRSVRIVDPLQGKSRIEVRYGDYAPVGEIALPRTIAVSLPNDGITIDMTRQLTAVNQPIAESLFNVTIPPDYTRR